jgi:hypothetical protein
MATCRGLKVAMMNNSTNNIIMEGCVTPSNVTADRTYNVNATSVYELADVPGTVIANLQSIGLLG